MKPPTEEPKETEPAPYGELFGNAANATIQNLTVTLIGLSGAGTEEAPYLIGSAEDLLLLESLLHDKPETYASAWFKQTQDIDLYGRNWLPIGTLQMPFSGTFDGQGKKIHGLTGSGGGDGYFGLFSVTKDATLKNMALEDVDIVLDGSYAGAGAIVGLVQGGSLTTSYVTGSITTSGAGSIAIVAQSIGGGGGLGGTGAVGEDGEIGVGGRGGAAGNGGMVTVTQTGDIATSGVAAHGVLAQSIGGGSARSRSAAG